MKPFYRLALNEPHKLVLKVRKAMILENAHHLRAPGDSDVLGTTLSF